MIDNIFNEIAEIYYIIFNCRFDEMIEMVANGKINVTPLVTHHFPLYKTQEAFETAARREGMKVMICCDEVEQG